MIDLESSLQDFAVEEQPMIATRESLLSRLRHKENDSWHEFFETYWKLIYNAARKCGLSEDESQEVVQETMIGVSKNIPSFRYDPSVCNFKTWLMNLIRWRIVDQIRARKTHEPIEKAAHLADERAFAELWDRDWERNLINAAVERVKMRVDPKHFQMFSYCVLQKNGAAETARVLNVLRARVHLANHRISRELAKELELLRSTTGERK